MATPTRSSQGAVPPFPMTPSRAPYIPQPEQDVLGGIELLSEEDIREVRPLVIWRIGRRVRW